MFYLDHQARPRQTKSELLNRSDQWKRLWNGISDCRILLIRLLQLPQKVSQWASLLNFSLLSFNSSLDILWYNQLNTLYSLFVNWLFTLTYDYHMYIQVSDKTGWRVSASSISRPLSVEGSGWIFWSNEYDLQITASLPHKEIPINNPQKAQTLTESGHA